MEFNEIFKYIAVVWHSICLRKFKSLLLVMLISFSIIVIGIFKPSIYKSEVTIFADTQNIIKPLLGNQAAVTNIKQSRTAQVRDIIYSPRQLNKVIDKIYGKGSFPTAIGRAEKLAALRAKIEVSGGSGNYIKISYQDSTPATTFTLLNEVVRLFVEDSANTKKDESRSAYNFIDQQVISYKKQMLQAENNLKRFKSTHLDGTEAEVETRISSLRNDIEDLKIQETETLTRIYSLKKQLYSQDKFSSNDYEASLYHSKLNELQQHLENLLLTYTDDYPAVADTRYQIKDMQNTIQNLNSKTVDKNTISSEFNPLYQEISSKLSTAQVSLSTIRNRLKAFAVLLDQAYERRKRVASNQAELSELNRDSAVVKTLYESMLANKEKARLSMVLDIEGQGVNYKIQEPASYPTIPAGIRFLHFFIAGPIIGLLCLIGFFIAKIVLDNKVRFASQLESFTNAPLLVCIEHTFSPSEKRKQRRDNLALTFFTLCAITIYVAAAIIKKYDIPVLDLITPIYYQLVELIK